MQNTAIRYPVTFGVRLPASAAEQLRQLAAADDRPPTALARRLLIEALEQKKQQVPE